MKQRIHIFGASGSGTTTIGKAIAEKLGYAHFDTDNFFWLSTEVPFTEARPIDERLRMMQADLLSADNWVLSGSLNGWGDPLIPLFELVVFVYVPQEERVKRLKIREYERYGNEIAFGGQRYEATNEFIEWAEGYDAGISSRNLLKHEMWMAELKCPLLKIQNDKLDDSIYTAIVAIKDGE